MRLRLCKANRTRQSLKLYSGNIGRACIASYVASLAILQKQRILLSKRFCGCIATIHNRKMVSTLAAGYIAWLLILVCIPSVVGSAANTMRQRRSEERRVGKECR